MLPSPRGFMHWGKGKSGLSKVSSCLDAPESPLDETEDHLTVPEVQLSLPASVSDEQKAQKSTNLTRR